MAKRHIIREGDWELVMGRLEELVLANSGEDEFEEIFKLLIGKLYSEIHMKTENPFRLYSTAAQTAEKINHILTLASVRWKGTLEDNPLSRLTDDHLYICVKELDGYSLVDTNLEVMDALFEYLVNKSKKGSKGQYFTPRHVVDCCVKILNPSLDEHIVDPACGSGGFLIHTFNHVKACHPDLNIDEYCSRYLWGFDFDQRAVRVAKALMLMSGDGSSNIFRLNSLLTPKIIQKILENGQDGDNPILTIEDVVRLKARNFKGFDAILTNPPFAGEIQEQNIIKSYKMARNTRVMERDVLFIERCIDLLRPGGRIAIVLPTNKFGSSSWGYLRDWILKKLRVVGVLGLGRNTFMPHTHQKTSILFGVKRSSPPKDLGSEKILFVVSEKEGKDTKGKIITKKDAGPASCVWDVADHDLSDTVDMFKIFINEENICWGK